MSESTPAKKPRRKRIKGIGGTLWKQLEPLNSIEFFKNKYKDEKITLVLNAIDQKWAAKVMIDHGVLSIDNVDNSQDMKQLRKYEGWDAYVATTTNIFFSIVTGQLSTGGMVKKFLGRKIKAKGIKKLRVLESLFNILEKEQQKTAGT